MAEINSDHSTCEMNKMCTIGMASDMQFTGCRFESWLGTTA